MGEDSRHRFCRGRDGLPCRVGTVFGNPDLRPAHSAGIHPLSGLLHQNWIAIARCIQVDVENVGVTTQLVLHEAFDVGRILSNGGETAGSEPQ